MTDTPEQPRQPSPWRALVGLVVLVVLMAGVWYIATGLRQTGRMQDCVASGRTNCFPIDRG